MHGEVWICSISKAVPISIGRGENRGREVTYHNVVRNLLKVGDWNGNAGKLDRAAGKYFPRGRRCRGGLCPGRQPRKARPDAGRGLSRRCTDSTFACVTVRSRDAIVVVLTKRGASGFRARSRCARHPHRRAMPQKKKDQLSLAQYGDNSPANRPDPDDPGGLGAEESGTERTGPTQDVLFAIQQGGRWAEVGRYYDSANDPVTACFRLDRGHGLSVAREFGAPARPSCSRAPVGAIMSDG